MRKVTSVLMAGAMAFSGLSVASLPARAGGGGAVAAGIIGFAAGAIVGSQMSHAHPVHRHYVVRRSGVTAEQRAYWRHIQASLNTIGYDAGPVDGAPGRLTRQAIRDFQLGLHAEPTGTLTPDQADVLFARARPQPPVNVMQPAPGPQVVPPPAYYAQQPTPSTSVQSQGPTVVVVTPPQTAAQPVTQVAPAAPTYQVQAPQQVQAPVVQAAPVVQPAQVVPAPGQAIVTTSQSVQANVSLQSLLPAQTGQVPQAVQVPQSVQVPQAPQASAPAQLPQTVGVSYGTSGATSVPSANGVTAPVAPAAPVATVPAVANVVVPQAPQGPTDTPEASLTAGGVPVQATDGVPTVIKALPKPVEAPSQVQAQVQVDENGVPFVMVNGQRVNLQAPTQKP